MEWDPQNPAAQGVGAAALLCACCSVWLLVRSLPHWRGWLSGASRLPPCPLTWLDVGIFLALLVLLVQVEAGGLAPALIVLGALFLYERRAVAAGLYWGMQRGGWLAALRTGGLFYLAVYLPFVLLAAASVWFFKKLGVEGLYQDPVRQLMESDDRVLLALLLCQALVLAPICEEILFRGVLYPFLKEKWGMGMGVVSSGLLFGIAHGHWPSFPVLALLGMLLALLYDRTGKLACSMSLHFFFNLGTTLYLLALKFGGAWKPS